MTTHDVTILWLKRDLRVEDNPALLRASEGEGVVIPLYVTEPDMWAQTDASARQWRFIAECLEGLADDFAALGAPLVLRTGEVCAVLSEIARATRATRILATEETGTAWSFARDRRVAAWAQGQGIVFEEVAQLGVTRRLRSRDGWAQTRERVMRAPTVAPPVLPPHGVVPGKWPSARDLKLPFDPCPGRQQGGRAQALSLLGGFLTDRGRDYRRAMSSPLEGATACSRMSPHIAWGTVSVREAHQAAQARRAETKGTPWAKSMQSFVSRVAWRDHFMQKLEDAPDLDRRCLHSAYENLRPSSPDPTRLAAWEKGETGLPFVDACMRSLIHTGWLNFRMRSMLMAVASYHLWLDWRATGPHLARMFTDYEPGIHWSQCQMQSGTTGINTLRIYNPVKQGMDQDPTGAFTRRWCPELADVPDGLVQTPWAWGQARALKYPAPIVDVAYAARAARDRVWAVRKSQTFHAEARQIVEKHASRKDGARRFQRDPVARPRRGDDRQMRMEF